MIEFRDVSKTYKSKKGVSTIALDHVSFRLPQKGFLFILGKSGSGKSTLLNILGGLDQCDSGDFIVDGKNTKKFRSKDFDYYRNTYIGFVFQEFHLIEEYNVYDNITLSLKLQKEKVDLAKVDSILAKVGMEGLGKRKINELSGGQKQRVAIARALIKNPQILLADEPTGSLDRETGNQIFSLLKEISKEKLVVVVSHDRESAITYADGIIEIQDGKIISNSISVEEEDSSVFQSKKSRLPFWSSLKFAMLNLGAKKVKLCFTILLVMMSLVFFGTSLILSKFDIEYSHAKTMIETKQSYVTIRKGLYNANLQSWYHGIDSNPLTEEDLSFIQKKLPVDSFLGYQINEDNRVLGLDINYKSSINSKETPIYYLAVASSFSFIEGEESFLDGKIIGHYPKNEEEVLIHSYLADYLMYYGVLPYQEKENAYKKEYYYPTSYEDLVNHGPYLKLGSTKVKVSGILLDDTDRFQNLKTTFMNDSLVDETWFGLPQYKDNSYEFQKLIQSKFTEVYVAPCFIENLSLQPNTVVDENLYIPSFQYNEKKISSAESFQFLDHKISLFTGEKFETIEKLNENEIVINENFLDHISKNDYRKMKEKYIENYKNEVQLLEEENKKIREENQRLLEEYQQNLEETEIEMEGEMEENIPQLQDEKEIVYRTDEELTYEFAQNYMRENQVWQASLSLLFRDTMIGRKEKIQEYSYPNVTIRGIQFSDEDRIYMADSIAKDLMKENKEVEFVVTNSKDRKELNEILVDFPLDDSKYISETLYSDIIDTISSSLRNISKIMLYASVLFGFFALVLLTNFIVNSIYYSKKTIGILRGLGAKKSDVFRIFLEEGFVIGCLSSIFALFLLWMGVMYVNQMISNHLFFSIDFVQLTVENIVILFGSVLGIVFLSSLFTVRKIAKMRPIDAILDK